MKGLYRKQLHYSLMVLKQRNYDVIVIGAGNGGLAATVELCNHGLDVLCLEKHNIPGGFASSFVRGRFEFEASLHVVAEVGSPENPDVLRKAFREWGININWIRTPEAFHLISEEENIDFVMPFGIENVISAINSYYPGTEEYARSYLSLCKEVNDAIGYIGNSEGKLKKLHFLKTFPNFVKTASYSVEQVLNALKIPQKIRNLFQGFWGYLAVPMNELNWGLWALMVHSFLNRGGYIPQMRSTELSLALTDKIRRSGGLVECNSKVTKIIVKDRKIWGVETIHGERIKCNYILSNASPTIVYNNLINSHSEVPPIAYKNVNSRSTSVSGFVVCLGLNKSAEEIGFDSYSKIIHKTSDTTKLNLSFKKLHAPDIAVSMCLNTIMPRASPEGTSMVHITTFFDPNAWEEVTPASYHQIKTRIAREIIKKFEKSTNIILTPYIEEIESSTPVTYAHYFDSSQGQIYGYGLNSWDHTISRVMMIETEEYIEGLGFVGAHALNQAFNSSYVSGITGAKRAYQKLVKNAKI